MRNLQDTHSAIISANKQGKLLRKGAIRRIIIPFIVMPNPIILLLLLLLLSAIELSLGGSTDKTIKETYTYTKQYKTQYKQYKIQ
jgi:hypothetical protein